MDSNAISSSTQTLFKSSNISSHSSFNFKNTHIRTPQISIRTPNLTTKATGNGFHSPETLYDLLGIPENGTLSDVKQAYKRMALQYHPDVSPPDRTDEYTVRFIRAQEAYETLSDPEARSMYDIGMAKGLDMAYSGPKWTRFDPGSEEKSRWKETWKVQVAELARGRRVNPTEGMSWGARIRKQRSESCG